MFARRSEGLQFMQVSSWLLLAETSSGRVVGVANNGTPGMLRAPVPAERPIFKQCLSNVARLVGLAGRLTGHGGGGRRALGWFLAEQGLTPISSLKSIAIRVMLSLISGVDNAQQAV
ncbi:uncharacterized protein SPSK_06654 [Sporothrix schenckii 1099-18]|uniref:Uncharacterized protein n=1 Tax=Sporothrix schenckii 1099-18 TaxID=1397361 RepID=A0A0F2MHQ6_SPOSC|nr:uncharacterized protein SPSK_06654 [Sporothrix schenckii 1099-18]KJR89157.1 hypothetical protein SPSK_06654 [Sporothrix schenckii 1099-18]